MIETFPSIFGRPTKIVHRRPPMIWDGPPAESTNTSPRAVRDMRFAFDRIWARCICGFRNTQPLQRIRCIGGILKSVKAVFFQTSLKPSFEACWRHHVLWDMLRQSVDAGIRVVQIHGPPGVGKTALAMWLSRRAHQFGSAETLRVVQGSLGGETAGLGGLLRRAWQAFGLDGDALRRRVFKRLSALGLQGDQAAMMSCLNASEDGLPDAAVKTPICCRWTLACGSKHAARSDFDH